MTKEDQLDWKKEKESTVLGLGQDLTVLLDRVASKEVISLLTDIIARQCEIEAETHRRIDLIETALRNYIETRKMELTFPEVRKADKAAVAETIKRIRHWANYLRALAQDKQLGYWPRDYFAEAD